MWVLARKDGEVPTDKLFHVYPAGEHNHRLIGDTCTCGPERMCAEEGHQGFPCACPKVIVVHKQAS